MVKALHLLDTQGKEYYLRIFTIHSKPKHAARLTWSDSGDGRRFDQRDWVPTTSAEEIAEDVVFQLGWWTNPPWLTDAIAMGRQAC